MKLKHELAFNVFSSFPEGVTRPKFEDLMTDASDKRSASARLSQFVKEGLAYVSGTEINPLTGHTCMTYTPTGVPFSGRVLETRAMSRTRKRPTDKELVELRKFKERAINMFPELAISAELLAARRKLAEIYRADGNEAKAALTESGQMDEGEAMRIALAFT